jgi:hypothetical protein
MSSYIHLATETLGSNATSVTFSSIPTTANGKNLRDLILIISSRMTSGTGQTQIRLNSVTSGYSGVSMEGRATSPQSGYGTGNAWWFVNTNNGDLDTVNAATIVQIYEFATSKHKFAISRGNNLGSGTSVAATAHRWANTSAITDILVQASATYAAGSTFSLYGIEG